MRILIATDADWVLSEIKAALGEAGTDFVVCRDGNVVSKAIAAHSPDIAILDMQIGNMGAIAACMALRLDASVGNAPDLPVLILLDRKADVHLARRAGANGWMIKPLDALRLRRAVGEITSHGCYAEGIPTPPRATDDTGEIATSETPEEEAAPVG